MRSYPRRRRWPGPRDGSQYASRAVASPVDRRFGRLAPGRGWGDRHRAQCFAVSACARTAHRNAATRLDL